MSTAAIYLILSLFVADQPDLNRLTIVCHTSECVQSVISRSRDSDVYRLRVLDAAPLFWGMNIVNPPIRDYWLH